MYYRSLLFFAVFISVGMGAFAARAESLVEPDYAGYGPKVTAPWYEYYSFENAGADLGFIAGMRPHHAGALTMAQQYLSSDKKSSARLQALARGIIRNQQFEIMMLDTIEKNIQKIDFSQKTPQWRLVAEQGLAQRDRFMRAPAPGIQAMFNGDDVVSDEDVRFAKAMIVHHEGALTMAHAYLKNPDAGNTYLTRMCLDILRDQAQEIQLMHNIIVAYPGNPDDIRIDPSMVHGMGNMMHHMDLSSAHGGKPY